MFTFFNFIKFIKRAHCITIRGNMIYYYANTLTINNIKYKLEEAQNELKKLKIIE